VAAWVERNFCAKPTFFEASHFALPPSGGADANSRGTIVPPSSAVVQGVYAGQGREALRGVDDFRRLRSLRACSALDRVSWVQRGLVEIAVGHWLTACYEIRAVVCSLPRASLLAGARFGLLSRGLPGLARNPFTLHDILRRRSSFCIRLGWGREEFTDPGPQAFDGSLSGLAQESLEFGEGVLDGIEVGL
jgi:hypothetical protein